MSMNYDLKSLIRAIVKTGQAQFHQFGLELGYNGAQITAGVAAIPTPAGKLRFIVDMKKAEVGDHQLRAELLEACARLDNPILGDVLRELNAPGQTGQLSPMADHIHNNPVTGSSSTAVVNGSAKASVRARNVQDKKTQPSVVGSSVTEQHVASESAARRGNRNPQPFLTHQGWKYDAFLCHTGVDKPFVRLLYEEMLNRDLVAFLDVDSLVPGDKVQEVICEAIARSPFFLVILSHKFKGKQYPEAELEAALAFDGSSKKVIPIFYGMTADDCGESTLPLYRKLSSYVGLERGSKQDSQFASDVADMVRSTAETQRHRRELKMVRVPKYIRNHDSDLDPLWHLRESQLKKQQKHIKGLFIGFVFAVAAILSALWYR